MTHLSVAKKFAAALVFYAMAANAYAQWALDGENSSLEFISTKNSSVAESHSFGVLSGSLSPTGSVTVAIELDSVNTLIEIRNERVRELLFETANFPLADIAASVDPGVLEKVLKQNEVITLDIPVHIALHGQQKTVSASVVLARTSGGRLLAVTSRPILIKAADFGLENGIELLRNVAGLNSISSAVPVSFRLEFLPTP